MGQAARKKLELSDRYEQGERDFSHSDLGGFDLSGIKLFLADLSQVNFFQTNLTGADLKQANLSGANLSQANLQNADLRGTNLNGANLRRADLTGAKVTNSQLQQAQITGAMLPNGKLFNGSLVESETALKPEEIQQDLQRNAKPEFQSREKEILPPIDRTFAQIKADMPYLQLRCLMLGAMMTGFLLAVQKAPLYAYLSPLLFMLACCRFAGLAWFAPMFMLGIVTVAFSNGYVVIFPFLIFAGLAVGFYTSRSLLNNPIRSAIWVTGLVLIVMLLYGAWMLNAWVLLPTIAMIVSTWFGGTLPTEMAVRRFHPKEILWVTQGLEFLGLLLGGMIGSALLMALS